MKSRFANVRFLVEIQGLTGLREVVLSLETGSWDGDEEGQRRGGPRWRQPSSAELRASVSWRSRAWWQSRAAGQGVAAGLWPGESHCGSHTEPQICSTTPTTPSTVSTTMGTDTLPPARTRRRKCVGPHTGMADFKFLVLLFFFPLFYFINFEEAVQHSVVN